MTPVCNGCGQAVTTGARVACGDAVRWLCTGCLAGVFVGHRTPNGMTLTHLTTGLRAGRRVGRLRRYARLVGAHGALVWRLALPLVRGPHLRLSRETWFAILIMWFVWPVFMWPHFAGRVRPGEHWLLWVGPRVFNFAMLAAVVWDVVMGNVLAKDE